MKALVGDKMVSRWEQRFEKLKTQWRGRSTPESSPQKSSPQKSLPKSPKQRTQPKPEMLRPKSPLRLIMKSQPSKESDSTTANSSSSTDEECELCTTALTTADQIFPILCTSAQCHFNACLSCTNHMVASAQNDLQEASDGNVFFLRLDKHCPDCRSDFVVSLRDVALLRDDYLDKERARVVEEDRQGGEGFEVDLNTCITGDAATAAMCGCGVVDSELSAQQLRSKYLNIDQIQDEEGKAQDLEYNVSLAKHRYEERIMDPHAGVTAARSVSTHQLDRLPSRQESKAIRQRVQYIDSKLYAGWEHAMSEAEQLYVKELMTSGSEEQLAQATEILASISQMNKTPATSPVASSSYSATHVPKLSTHITSHHGRQAHAHQPPRNNTNSPKSKPPLTHTPMSRPIPITRQGTNGSRSAASASVRNGVQTRTPSSLQREFSQRRAIEDMYPFPSRMPVSFQLPVMFRPMDNQPILTFSDDESFYQDWQKAVEGASRRFNVEERNQRIKVALVDDAYHRLSHNMWQVRNRKRIGNEVGIDHVKRGVRVMPPVQSEDFIKDDDVDPFDENDEPWRRVVVTAVKGPIGRLGVRVGDVVTHVDGDRFRGNADTLRAYLEKRRKKMKTRGANAMLASGSHIVVNADKGTAYAIRTLSFLAATDFQKGDAEML